MNREDDILKDAPDYEQYTENEAVLTVEEKRELGLIKCGGCCSKKNNGSNKGCCKSK